MAISLTATETEVFSGQVGDEYYLNDYFGTVGMRFFGKRATEVINDPIMEHGTAKHKEDGTDHSANDSDMVGNEIPLFTPFKAMNTIKKSQVDVRPDLNIVSNAGKANGESIGQGKTIRLINALLKVAIANNNIVEVNDDITDGTAPARMKQAFKELGRNMDISQVTASGRRCLLYSSPWYEMVDEQGVIRKDWGGPANVQTAGGPRAMINYLNFDIVNCPLAFLTDYRNTAHAALELPDELENDNRNYIGVVWQTDAWALRHQTEIENSVDWIAHMQHWLALSRMQIGFKARLLEGIWAIKRI